MKKTNLKSKIIIIALLVLVFFIMLSNNMIVKAAGSTKIDPDGGGSLEEVTYKKGDEFRVYFGTWSMNENVLCVEHGQPFSPGSAGMIYKVKDCYEITGTDILINGTSINPSDKLLNYAQGIAYILSLNNAWGSNKEESNGSNEGIAQHVLWAYLYNMYSGEEDNYAKKVGMYRGNKDCSLTSAEQAYYDKAVEICNGTSDRNYSAKYHIFEKPTNASENQRLIILEKTSDTEADNKKIKITINKTDAYDSTIKVTASFDVIFKQGDKTVKTNSLTTSGGSDSTTVEISDTSDLTVTIKEKQTQAGYLLLAGTEGITLTYKFENHQWKLKDWNIPDADSSLVTISGKETNSVTLNVKNEVNREFSLTLDKKSSIEGADVDGTIFEFDFYFIKEFKIKGKYLPAFNDIPFTRDVDYIVEVDGLKWIVKNSAGEKIGETYNRKLKVDGGSIIVDKFTPSPNFWGNERKSVYISVKEDTAKVGYEKINRTIFIAVNLKNKDNITINEYIYPTDLIKEFKDLYEMFMNTGKIEVQGITSLENATSDTKEEINEISVKSGTTVYLKLTNKKLITITGTVWEDGQTGIKTSSGPDGKMGSSPKGLAGINVYLCKSKIGNLIDDFWKGILGDNFDDSADDQVLSDLIVACTQTDENGKYVFKDMEYLANLYIVFEYDGVNYIEVVDGSNGKIAREDSDSKAQEGPVKIKKGAMIKEWVWDCDCTGVLCGCIDGVCKCDDSEENKARCTSNCDGKCATGKNKWKWVSNITGMDKISSRSRIAFNDRFKKVDNAGAHQIVDITTVDEKIKAIFENVGDGEFNIDYVLNTWKGHGRLTEILEVLTDPTKSRDAKKIAIKEIIKEAEYDNITALDYNMVDEHISKVVTTNHSDKDKADLFKIYAKSDVKKENVNDNAEIIINCGLVKREFDLDLSTNLDSVSTKINGKTTNYDYSIDNNGNATLYARTPGNEGDLGKQNVTYNQKIYESDYNYSIADYMRENIEEFDATDKAEQLDKDIDDIKTKGTKDLDVYVTYKIQVNNQTNKNAYIYTIDDYFSADLFELDPEKGGAIIAKELVEDEEGNTTITSSTIESDKNADGNYNIHTIDGKNYYKIKIIPSDSKCERKEIYLTFRVKLRNDDGTPRLNDTNSLVSGNIAEISCYGSDEGYIDMNSQPGNNAPIKEIKVQDGIKIVSREAIRYEDDTDTAGILNIELTEEQEARTLSGVVWDDANEDGIYNNNEKTIDGVTVQLIEIREIKPKEDGPTYQLEYIWQETKTGSSDVKRINMSGTGIESISNGGTNKGEYKFIGYIPGNYIVRYKYGTADMLNNAETKKYDGNSYKSTIDARNTQYKNVTLNIIEVTESRYSNAFDNEARRLEEMALFSGENFGETIDAKALQDLSTHWMCAETAKFEVYGEDPVGNAIDNKEQVKKVDTYKVERQFNGKDIVMDDSGVCRYKSGNNAVHGINNDNIIINYAVTNKANGVDSSNDCSIVNMDFGLMERPQTQISLEKHLTGLSIDVAGEGKILDAKFDIENYLKERDKGNNPNVADYVKGNSNNLTQVISTRDERGFWKFETDVNELMNGAELKAEYTYVVSNNTEENSDYLSAQLMNTYEQFKKGGICKFIYEEDRVSGKVTTLVPIEDDITFKTILNDIAERTKTLQRKHSDGKSMHTNGYYLGDYYYTGKANNIVELNGGTPESKLGEQELSAWANKLAGVTVRIHKIEELLNNEFEFDEEINYSSYGVDNNFSQYKDRAKTPLTSTHAKYKLYKEDPRAVIEIEEDSVGPEKSYTRIQSQDSKKSLEPNTKNYDKKIVLTKTLNTNNIKDISFPSYNAEILSYSVASGRRSTSVNPGNLTYSYSADSEMTLENCFIDSSGETYKFVDGEYINLKTGTAVSTISGARKLNEIDEYWGETIIITAPTGNNTILWIILGITCALIIAGGVFGIRKFVLKH